MFLFTFTDVEENHSKSESEWRKANANDWLEATDSYYV